jgi:hypothetical protein
VMFHHQHSLDVLLTPTKDRLSQMQGRSSLRLSFFPVQWYQNVLTLHTVLRCVSLGHPLGIPGLRRFTENPLQNGCGVLLDRYANVSLPIPDHNIYSLFTALLYTL